MVQLKCVVLETAICVCMPIFKLLLLVAAMVCVQDLAFALVTVSNFTIKLFPSTPSFVTRDLNSLYCIY